MNTFRPSFPHPRTLDALLEQFAFRVDDDTTGIEITGITMDSTQIIDGDLFVGLPGRRQHGATYSASAMAAGARAILTDEDGARIIADQKNALSPAHVPVLVSEDPRAAMAHVAAWLYRTGVWRESDYRETIFGVTGTNGKTSVAYVLSALLEHLGRPAGMSTTAARRIGQVEQLGGLTTPESTELHALLARMREDEVRDIVLEVSAQALTRNRVDAIEFDVAGFTNLSHDHLDDYDSMEAYYQAKLELFNPERAHRGVVCVDSQWGMQLAQDVRIPAVTITSRPDRDADWRVEVTTERLDSTSFVLHGRGVEIHSSIPIMGFTSASNAALAMVMLIESGVDAEFLADTVRDGIDVYIPGRAEIVSESGDPTVIIDYAHTPDAFETLLQGVRRIHTGRVIFVFGAPGSRDTTKRGEMARIAARDADVVVVTDYNPRMEDPALIRKVLLDAIREVEPGQEVHEVPEPRDAIRAAIQMAAPGDVVVYAGPGHRDTHEVGGKKLPFSARDEARLALEETRWSR